MISLKNFFNQHYLEQLTTKFLYQEISQRMIAHLNYVKISPQKILDLGSGLNIDRQALKKIYPQAQVIAVDLALNMLKHYSRTSNPIIRLFNQNNELINANVNQLPFKNEQFDLLWGNLILAFLNNYTIFLNELTGIIRVGGNVLLSGLGVDSLVQLRELGLKTQNFPDMHQIGDLLVKSGFDDIVTSMEHIDLEYDSLSQMLTEIKKFSPLKNFTVQDFFYLGKEKYLQLMDSQIKNNPIKLTLEIFYVSGWKIKTTTRPTDHVIKFYPPSNN